jgi:hypothetical protein
LKLKIEAVFMLECGKGRIPWETESSWREEREDGSIGGWGVVHIGTTATRPRWEELSIFKYR